MKKKIKSKCIKAKKFFISIMIKEIHSYVSDLL